MVSGVPGDIRTHVLTGVEQVQQFWSWLTKPGREFVAVDTENNGLDPLAPGFHCRMIQFGDETRGWAIPFQGWRRLVEQAVQWCSRARVDMVWFNLPYDSQALLTEGIEIDWSIQKDLFPLVAVSGFCDELHGLKDTAMRELGGWAGVGERVLKQGMKNGGWDWATVPFGWRPYPLYGSVDVVITARVWRKWAARFERWHELHDLEVSVGRITGDMSRRGMPVDLAYLDEQVPLVHFEETTIFDRIKHDYGFDVGKPAQLVAFLKKEGAFPPDPVLTDKGQLSVDQEALSRIKHPVAAQVVRWRWLHRCRVNYLENLRSRADGDARVHATINSMVAKTGRMSISEPPLQQLPDDPIVRRAITGGGEDDDAISCDYSQIELRLWASMNDDQALIQALKDADQGTVDFFTGLCRTIYAEPGFLKADHRRTQVKSSTYAKIFAGGIEVAAATAGVSISQMTPTWRKLGQTFPSMLDVGKKLVVQGQMHDGAGPGWWIDSPTGRRFAVKSKNEARVLPNYVTQGTAAIALKKALVKLEACGLGPYLILPVHDEVLASAPKKESREVALEIGEIMSSVLTEEEWGIGVPTEPGIGPNWQVAKKTPIKLDEDEAA